MTSLIYLATPYTKAPGGIEMAFIRSCELAARLIKTGRDVFSPIAHSHPIALHGKIDPLDHDLWMDVDQAMIARCDALVVAMLPGWDRSKGVAAEVDNFKDARKPILWIDPETLEAKDWWLP